MKKISQRDWPFAGVVLSSWNGKADKPIREMDLFLQKMEVPAVHGVAAIGVIFLEHNTVVGLGLVYSCV